AQVETTTSDYDKEKLQERLSRLSGGVAVIHVGAATETELKERKHRVEDALHSVRAALEEGVVPGGGVALLRVIAGNAGYDPSLAVRKVRAGAGAFGFDAEKGEFLDLKKSGVLDP